MNFKPIARTYWNYCDVYELETVKTGSITKKDWKIVYQQVPCALSQKGNSVANQTEASNQITQQLMIFMDDELEIKDGSRIICDGYVLQAAKPFVYKGSHQEIPVTLMERA